LRVRFAILAVLALIAAAGAQTPAAVEDPTPASIEEFTSAAARILRETGVPGAGISLVRADRVEWEGGIGVADRERNVPVTADTHFRVGSISKTFVAMSLVQLSEDGLIDLEDPVNDIAPDVAIDNPWSATDPVRVIHLLQHTAGFDDMHLNERYVTNGPDLPLLEVLARNPASRRVRWQPGTIVSYSNPGYTVAGYLIEKVSARRYSDYIYDEIFSPLGMNTSSFELNDDDHTQLATGYTGPEGAGVGYPRIYHRPAGNMHSSARELGLFVRMLLNWGELGTAFVVDPEYLGNMEQPRTSIATRAGLRNGYGSGIFTMLDLPYLMLGHNGGIDGFYSTYAYSPSRDVGFVVLLNVSGPRVADASRRLNSLAVRFLKRDVTPPAKPSASIDGSILDGHAGYYHDANPRNQLVWAVQWLLSGWTIARDGDALSAQPVFGDRTRLVPVSESLFRLEHEIGPSRVFTVDADGAAVLAGTSVYAARQPRWRIEIVRVPVMLSAVLLLSVFAVALVWVARIGRAGPRGFWGLKSVLLLCPITLILPFAALALTPGAAWGEQNAGTVFVFLSTLALPALAVLGAMFTLFAYRQGASRWLVTYALAMICAVGTISTYLGASGLLGIRLWMY
jgi:CubicO group peptidase (beta-lactamase class C family)